MLHLPILVLVFFFSLFPGIFTKLAYASSTQNLIAEINAYRQSHGLATVTTDPYTCNFAKLRAQEAATGFNHNGFYTRIKSKTLPYPSYRLVTENLAWAPSGQDVVNMWINSPAHAANMLKNTTLVCVENYGDYYALEGWKS